MIKLDKGIYFYSFKFRLESTSDLGKNLACSAVIAPDASDGSPPEDPYA